MKKAANKPDLDSQPSHIDRVFHILGEVGQFEKVTIEGLYRSTRQAHMDDVGHKALRKQ